MRSISDHQYSETLLLYYRMLYDMYIMYIMYMIVYMIVKKKIRKKKISHKKKIVKLRKSHETLIKNVPYL